MKTKVTVIPLVLLLLFSPLISTSAQLVDIDNPALHRAAIGTGAAIGLTLDTYIGFIAFSDPEIPPWATARRVCPCGHCGHGFINADYKLPMV